MNTKVRYMTITDNLDTKIDFKFKPILSLTIVNTSLAGAVNFDLFLQQGYGATPNIIYLNRGLQIPMTISLTLDADNLSLVDYENYQLYIKSNSATGDLNLIIRQ
jgi:hypothetical protein